MDYSDHIIELHKHLKLIRKHTGSNEYDKAVAIGMDALVELRLAITLLKAEHQHKRD